MPAATALDILKKKTVKAQTTTTKRTTINPDQQWSWHNLVDSTYDTLRNDNTCLCKKSGKNSGEVLLHFIIRLDERCLLDYSTGHFRISGSATKKKHEKNVLAK